MADDYAALIASSIILINAYKIARPAIDELMDASPDEGLARSITSAASSVPGVLQIEKTYIRKTGSAYLSGYSRSGSGYPYGSRWP